MIQPATCGRPSDVEDYLRDVLNALSANIAILAADGTIRSVNRAWCTFAEANDLDWDDGDCGRNYLTVCDAAADDTLARAAGEGLRDVLAGRRPDFYLEYPCHSPDEQRWFELRATPFRHGTEGGAVVAHENITARKLTEIALRTSEERYDLVVRGSTDGIWDWDITTDVVYRSPRLIELLGFDVPDVVEPHFRFFDESLHPDDRMAVRQAIDAHLRHRRPYDIEYRLKTRDGTYRWYRARGQATWSDEGKPLRMAGSITDVTTRKAYETRLEQIADELRRSNQDLEHFAYVASHDLQEPLRMVISYLELLERRYTDRLDDAGREFIGYAVDGAARMRRLINDLLVYSRAGTDKLQLADVHCAALLEGVRASLAARLAETQTTIISGDLPVVRGDFEALARLFQNLIGNAIKFRSERSPEIRISAGRDGDDWIIAITDNGIGIEPQYQQRVFGMFQRLHARSEYEGTGIGLAVCRRIVERHRGRIWIESAPGRGTTVQFTLPGNEQGDRKDESHLAVTDDRSPARG